MQIVPKLMINQYKTNNPNIRQSNIKNVSLHNHSTFNFKANTEPIVKAKCKSDIAVQIKKLFKNVIPKNKFYSKFISEYQKQYPNIPIEDTLKNIILTTTAYNSGKDKQVFIFPKMDDYVIGYFRGKSLNNIPQIHSCKMQLPKYYFGQPIATNDNNIIIMKKVEGVPSSCNNYHAICKNIRLNNSVTEECSQEYLSKLRMFKDFPQDAYDNFAKRLIYINKHSDMIDIANPNNLLIDTKNKMFNLIDMIDLIDLKKFYKNIFVAENKTDEFIKTHIETDKKQGLIRNATISFWMYSLLLDSKLQPYFLDKLSLDEQKEVVSISKDVIKKCKTALKNNGFNKNETSTYSKIQFRKSEGVVGDTFVRRYQEFLDLYNLN